MIEGLVAMPLAGPPSMSICPSPSANFCPLAHSAVTCLTKVDSDIRITSIQSSSPQLAIAGLKTSSVNMDGRQVTFKGCNRPLLDHGSNSSVKCSYLDSCMIDSLIIASPNVIVNKKERRQASVLQGLCFHCHGQSFLNYSNNHSTADATWRDRQNHYEVPNQCLRSLPLPQALPTLSPDLSSVMDSCQTAEAMFRTAQACYAVFTDAIVVKAFREAKRVHHAKYQTSDDHHLDHCVETAKNLASLGASKEVVAAGLLHDVIDKPTVQCAAIKETFGEEVAYFVKEVFKISEFSKMARDNNITSKTTEANRLHTMFLAMTDTQVILIQLADRLHSMQTLEAFPQDKQLSFAKETLKVFVPLANRLGIWSWKAELEDLCFKHLEPQEYQKLREKLYHGFRQSAITASIEKLGGTLQKIGILYYELTGRHKNIFSIYTKMKRKNRNLYEMHDLQGIRLIVMSKDDCYAALELIHMLWPQFCTEVKDYIAQPKINGYQSLHTIVCSEGGLPLEIQIRTREMHYQAEFGVAAHWRYKEDNVAHSSFILQMVAWARLKLIWQCETPEIGKHFLLSNVSLHISFLFQKHLENCTHVQLLYMIPPKEDDPLYVIILEDDKMTVDELQGGATVADLCHRRLTDNIFAARCGLTCDDLHPIVNHKVVDDIQQELRMGDLVELRLTIPYDSLMNKGITETQNEERIEMHGTI
ncbi:hypothetical protein KP509_19G001700 [Ceratopteris richardii]|uniref:GTP diphosphokinase n=1 Tax=Ceratopteris richardii TaxID=49495 RepID=A0A8T2SJJ1_CERRI|nr:hypothetical protein KP509_19G001700 [Ceratopteris richardii]